MEEEEESSEEEEGSEEEEEEQEEGPKAQRRRGAGGCHHEVLLVEGSPVLPCVELEGWDFVCHWSPSNRVSSTEPYSNNKQAGLGPRARGRGRPRGRARRAPRRPRVATFPLVREGLARQPVSDCCSLDPMGRWVRAWVFVSND